eukprot:COSAG02_NODE_13_length_57813_cov_14.298276_41_plen_100_part_00
MSTVCSCAFQHNLLLECSFQIGGNDSSCLCCAAYQPDRWTKRATALVVVLLLVDRDWKSKKIYKSLRAHDGPVVGCITHPLEASKVATCSWDGLIKYWD